MGYIVLNCRDLEHRAKAVERLEAAGYTFKRCLSDASDAELQIYNPFGYHNGELGFDILDGTSNKHTKIKSYITALEAAKQTD